MKTLFSDSDSFGTLRDAPLAERMRPRTLDEMVGQTHLIGPGKVLSEMIRDDQLMSMIFWGPPGTGKTTLALIIARETRSAFLSYSAVLSGIKEIKSVMSDAGKIHRSQGRKTILFVDEIHRFNKAQQDAFLPYVESGVIILIGATTENPSFEVISALLSRAKVYVLEPLQPAEIETIVTRALEDEERGLGRLQVQLGPEELHRLAVFANGDARIALNLLETAVKMAARGRPQGPVRITPGHLEEATQRKVPLYDKSGEEHFNLISALHKSMRNSDPDAALYWLGRMLEGGEDPVYIARRMVRFASEDVGLADNRALAIALDATEAVRLVGLPECKLALAQAAVYLSVAPKSNSLYRAYEAVVDDVQQSFNEPPPLHIRNAPTRLMKELGYGEGYQYAHDFEEKVADMVCLPAGLAGRKYYHPTDQGTERQIKEILARIEERRRKQRPGPTRDDKG
ncbi:MAG: replication-associated recombination protein A [Acidobacteria bacterium]|nr:replication-associated recombination protein A [Acidobacteriota bacterium]